MVWGINIKKNKGRIRRALWSRRKRSYDFSDLEHLFDLYWGGPERRITGLTVRIIAINAIALLVLMIGTLYIGRYEANMIESKIGIIGVETSLISASLATGAVTEDHNGSLALNKKQLQKMVYGLLGATTYDIQTFDASGNIITDSRDIYPPFSRSNLSLDTQWLTIRVLKDMAKVLIKWMPDRRALPLYRLVKSNNIKDYDGTEEVFKKKLQIAAWRNEAGQIIITAATPIIARGKIVGAVILSRKAYDIQESVANFWLDIIRGFLITLAITIFLSIYLSGFISRPLRKLARAAEQVGNSRAADRNIPDLSYRHDEIGDLSVILRKMTEILYERMHGVEAFASDVAHELKNPLTSLKSAVETLKRVKKQSDQEKLLGVIEHDIQRIDRLITDISQASRLDSELTREEFSPVDLGTLLKSVLESYQAPLARDQSPVSAEMQALGADCKEGFNVLVDGKILQLCIAGSTENIYVLGMGGRLEQVFKNLIDNAISFSPKGGVITVSLLIEYHRVRVTVEDEGPGIPQGKIHSVFERFYSERPGHEAYGNHSGLGLAICKQIIEAHRGKIFAENIKGSDGKNRGARFSVILNYIQK